MVAEALDRPQDDPASSLSSRWFAWIAILGAGLALLLAMIDQAAFWQVGVSRGQILGRDFSNTWTGARLFLEGRTAEIFQPNAYTAALQAFWPQMAPVQSFSYPPVILPLTAWLGTAPYPVALALWTLLGVLGLAAAAWPATRSPGGFLALACAPAVLLCVCYGQTGLIVGALLLGGLRLADRRPGLAGLLIGLAVFKPHAALLVPLGLMAAGRWRTFGSAAITAVAVVALSLPVAGLESWRLYLSETLPYQGVLYTHGGFWLVMTPSPLVALREAGFPEPAAAAAQLLVSLGAAALVWFRFARRRDAPIAPLDLAILFAATGLASPYSFNYDLAGLTAALLLYVAGREQLDVVRRVGVALAWWTPGLMLLFWAVWGVATSAASVTTGFYLLAPALLLLAAPKLRLRAQGRAEMDAVARAGL